MNNAVRQNRIKGRNNKGVKSALVTVIAGTLVVVATACGNTTTENLPTPSASATAAAVTSVAGTSVNGFATKKELGADSQGRKFVQTTLSSDDKMLAYQPAQVTEQTSSLFSVEEIQTAQKVAMLYYAEELTDSELKGDNITKADKDLWLESMKDDIDPEQLQEFADKLTTYDPKDGVVYENPDRVTKGYALDYNENNVQLISRKIELNRVLGATIDGKRYIGFVTDIKLELPVTKDGEKAVESVRATATVTMRQVTPGVWKYAGAKVSVDSVEYSK